MPASWNVPADPADPGDALHWFRQRLPLTDEDFDQLDESSRLKAFVVTGASQMDLVDQIFQAVDDALSNGTTLADFKDAIAEQLEDAWGRSDSPRLENIFRTNLQTAYGDARYETLNDPAVKKLRPYRRFVAIEDERLCPTCEAADGTLLAADDPWWDSHWTPLHYQCRCEINSAGEAEAAELGGVDEEAPKVAPLEGFGKPQQLWEPDLSEYPPEIAAVYRARLG